MAKNFTFKKCEKWTLKFHFQKNSYEKHDFTFSSKQFHEKYNNYIYTDQEMVKIWYFACEKCRNTAQFGLIFKQYACEMKMKFKFHEK